MVFFHQPKMRINSFIFLILFSCYILTKMNNISIYKITSDKTDKCYVGSTKNSVSKRFFYHKSNYNKYCDGRNSYCSSYEIIDLDFENVKVELIEKCSQENRKERERYWIRTLNSVNTRQLKTTEETKLHQRLYDKQRRLRKKLNI